MSASALLLTPMVPPTYHRIVSDTLTIPSDRAVSIPVGLLACQRNPLLQYLDTYVVSAQQAPAPPTPARAKKSKSASAPASSLDLLEVILHDTVLFPEGGGQPSDIGLIAIYDSDGKLGDELDVIEIKRRGGTAVHFVKAGKQDVGRFSSGARVQVRLGDAGVARRLDHMSLHTTQHLLSAVLESELQLPTLSWSLTTAPAPCYVELPRALIPEEIEAVQAKANALVRAGRAVHVEVSEFERETYDDVPTVEVGNGKSRAAGKGIPQDYEGGVKRVIVIDGVDRNPCCGTHLPSLHDLQLFLLPSIESVSRAGTNNGAPTTTARLSFLAGPRLLQHLTSTHAWITHSASLLSCAPASVPDRIGQVIEDRRQYNKRVDALEGELASRLAEMYLALLKAGPKQRHEHRTDDTAGALAFLGLIAGAVFANAEPGADYLLVVSSSPSAQSQSSTSVVVVVGSDEARVKAIGEGLKAKLGVKGGGKGPRWSGKFTGVWKENKEAVAIKELIGQ